MALHEQLAAHEDLEAILALGPSGWGYQPTSVVHVGGRLHGDGKVNLAESARADLR
jgi:hypothetical protein